MLNKIIFSVTLAALLNACAISPTGRKQLIFMPDNEVNQMGLQAFDDLKRQKPISKNPAYNQVVQCVANALTRNAGGNWEVVVFEDDSFNAFALPGSKIGVHTGLLKLIDNQDQLAAVIGHEIGHVLAKHSNERLSNETAMKTGMGMVQSVAGLGATSMGLLGLGAEYGVLLPFSRDHESEADVVGLGLMSKAGFDPTQSVTLWQKMSQASQGQQPPEFMSTHPANATRIQSLQQHMPTMLQVQQQALANGKQPHCTQ
ncbi:MAG: M48 family metallopeptidase [Methylococcales bacterium]|nr:M48 family metallopeptidase [Methylococcales bacterium]